MDGWIMNEANTQRIQVCRCYSVVAIKASAEGIASVR